MMPTNRQEPVILNASSKSLFSIFGLTYDQQKASHGLCLTSFSISIVPCIFVLIPGLAL